VGQVCKKNQKKKFLVYLGPYIRFLRPDAQNMYGAGVQLFFFEFLKLFFALKVPHWGAQKVPHLGAQICTRLSTQICTGLSIKSAFFFYHFFPTTAHKPFPTTAHKRSVFTKCRDPHKNFFTTNVCTRLSTKKLRIWAHAFSFFFVRRSGERAYTSAPYILKKNKKGNPRR